MKRFTLQLCSVPSGWATLYGFCCSYAITSLVSTLSFAFPWSSSSSSSVVVDIIFFWLCFSWLSKYRFIKQNSGSFTCSSHDFFHNISDRSWINVVYNNQLMTDRRRWRKSSSFLFIFSPHQWQWFMEKWRRAHTGTKIEEKWRAFWFGNANSFVIWLSRSFSTPVHN